VLNLETRTSPQTPINRQWKFDRGGWLQVYQLPERAGSGSCTLAVGDIDEIAAHLQTLGIDPSARNSSPRVKTIMITDPDGNHLAFAQASDQTMAH
jgi:hypothetical protein